MTKARRAVRTVTGDVAADQLGPTNYHEHLFQVSPLLPGDELDDEQRSTREAQLLEASGFAAMVDATPTGLGRDPAALARISRATGLRIVATTGAHREAHYAAGHWLLGLSTAELADRFVADLMTGIPCVDDDSGTPPAQTAVQPNGNPVRAGVVKAGVDYWSISVFERRVLTAVAAAHGRTGAPVMVHLEYGSAAFEVLTALAAEGVPASRVVLAHVDRNPDPGLHAELACAGAYLGYDGFGRHRNWPDSTLISCLAEAVERGAASRIVLGGDVARRSRYLSYGGMPGLGYLGDRVLPRLRQAVGEAVIDGLMVANPAALLGWITIGTSMPESLDILS